MYAHGSSMHQKCSNHALTNLLSGLCWFLWIIDLVITCLRLHLIAPVCLSALEVLRTRERTLILFFRCFHFWTHIWVFQRMWGASIMFKTIVEQIERYGGFYSYLYPFGDVAQENFQNVFYVCIKWNNFLRTFLTWKSIMN